MHETEKMTSAFTLALTRIVCCALAFSVASSAWAKLVVMHGYADVTSALVWIQADTPGPIRVSWRAAGAANEQSTTLDARAADEMIVVARLTGLAPGSRASYRIEGDNDRREGFVQTQPAWSGVKNAPDITIAIGSCFFLADSEPVFAGRSDYGSGFEIFDAIAAKKPDLMVWLGDNLYFQRPDFLDPASMAMRHRRQRAFEPLSRLLTATSHIAIWDDHDYGWNNADGAYPLKGDALRLFKAYWANPSFGLPETPGVFGFAVYGDVDLLLTDGRYYRSNARLPDSPTKTMFGAAQLEWIKSMLLQSRAPVKLFVSGSQIWNAASRFDGLYEFPTEQKALADFLLTQRIDGLLFVTGDRHFGELLRIQRPGAYPFYEFTSSPLTSRPWEEPEANERNNPQVVPGTLVGKRQFGLIRVAGPGNDRRIALETYDQKGELLWRQELRASALRFPRRPASE
ncbi:MAG TPA: alkaline phosphatase D family protein [Casimicrobiaceae bacterium]|nr:alkaline phosphatase D family protein [Casimicrobiaceae bacterium]